MADFLQQIIGGIYGSFAIIGPIILVLGGLIYAARSGFMAQYKYTVLVNMPRASGLKRVVAKGRFLGGKERGKFAIKYGMFDVVKVNAPGEEMVAEGDIIEGTATSRNEIRWEAPRIRPDGSVALQPAVPEAEALVFVTEHDITYQATHKQNELIAALKDWVIPIVVAIIVAGSIWGGGMAVADGFNNAAASIKASNEKLFGSTTYVVLYKPDTNGTASPAAPSGSGNTPLNIPGLNNLVPKG